MNEKKWRVLVVDDEPNNLQLMAEILNNLYNLSFAPNGVKALEITNKLKPDIILLDIMMPEMDGYEVCKRLKTEESTKNIPVIFVTAKVEDVDEVRGFKLGAIDYITKPFRPSIVKARVKNHLALRTAQEEIEKKNRMLEAKNREQKIARSRFVPSEFLKILNKDSLSELKLSDCIEKKLSVIFSDIRSYTNISESLSHEAIFHLLNDYFAHINPAISKYNGFIDKFIGDAIMALFPESPEDAVAASIEMYHSLKSYNIKREEAGLIPIKSGFGIHYGELIIGTVGTPDRMDTTVIGDTVNLASRLESATKTFKVDIILSDNLYQKLPNPEKFCIREIDTVRVKGKQQPVMLYEAFDTNEPSIIEQKRKTISMLQEALIHYKDGAFDNALELFKQCKESCPEDSIPPIYIRRCATLLRVPPGPDWAGISGI